MTFAAFLAELISFIPRAVVQGIPLLYGSTGETLTEKSGNLNLGIPGVMYVGGISGVVGAFLYDQGVRARATVGGVLDPQLLTTDGGSDRQSVPYPYPELEKWPGNELVAYSLPTVGASLPHRDYTDCYMVDECRSFGTDGVIISTEDVMPYGKPSTWKVWGGNARTDTDKDGMPDAWETANGTDPAKNDAMAKAANGYANIENYINSITAESVDAFLRAPQLLGQADATPTTITLQWRDWTEGEEGFIV